jgi:hypothetical protein
MSEGGIIAKESAVRKQSNPGTGPACRAPPLATAAFPAIIRAA